jgi:hypothetical protein
MQINSCFGRAAAILLSPQSGHGDEKRPPAGPPLPKPLGEFPAIHPWQNNLEDYHVEEDSLGCLQGGRAVHSDLYLVPEQAHQ